MEQQKKRLERAVMALRQAEAEAEKREAEWLDELIEARVKLMELREELTAKERGLNDRWVPTDPTADITLRTLLSDRERAMRKLEEARKVLAKQTDPTVQRLSKEVKELEERVKARQQALKQEASDRMRQRDEGFARLRLLRRDLLVAEEKVRALQRRQERQREEVQRDLEEQGRRVRQSRQALEDAASDAPRSVPAADLERKLDRVLRELAELRRELRRLKEP
jgi:hypothetical protein